MTNDATPALRPLRIAMLGHKGIPAAHGGIERHVDEIARCLVRRGHHVDVFNRPYHPYAPGEYEGVHILRRPSIPTKHLDAGTHTALGVLEVVLSRRYDLLHVHGIGPGIFVGLARPFIPTVFTFHAQDWRQRKWGSTARWWLRRGESVAVQRANAVICVSRLLQSYVAARYGRQAFYIPNGARLVPAPEARALEAWGLVPGQYLLFVGRLISDRGLPALLEAYAGLPAAPPLVIVGDVQHDRDYVDELRRRADPRVVFTGYQTGTPLATLYAYAMLCVHPSEVEGLPIAVLEAMSHGRAVLVSDIPENLEAVGDAGARFRVGDVASLRNALQELLTNPEMRQELGRRARARIALEYDWERIASDTERVYATVSVGARSLESGANGLQRGAST
jgi:glycosyltransferase involved in cell wall biosynthesis